MTDATTTLCHQLVNALGKTTRVQLGDRKEVTGLVTGFRYERGETMFEHFGILKVRSEAAPVITVTIDGIGDVKLPVAGDVTATVLDTPDTEGGDRRG